jgi:hypothetical protein
MSKTVTITRAVGRLVKGGAFGLAKHGYRLIAGVEIWTQFRILLYEFKKLGSRPAKSAGQFDPQRFSLDDGASRVSIFGGLVASLSHADAIIGPFPGRWVCIEAEQVHEL